jgi:hypothetical protein
MEWSRMMWRLVVDAANWNGELVGWMMSEL